MKFNVSFSFPFSPIHRGGVLIILSLLVAGCGDSDSNTGEIVLSPEDTDDPSALTGEIVLSPEGIVLSPEGTDGPSALEQARLVFSASKETVLPPTSNCSDIAASLQMLEAAEQLEIDADNFLADIKDCLAEIAADRSYDKARIVLDYLILVNEDMGFKALASNIPDCADIARACWFAKANKGKFDLAGYDLRDSELLRALVRIEAGATWISRSYQQIIAATN